jgi:hypothetical protein
LRRGVPLRYRTFSLLLASTLIAVRAGGAVVTTDPQTPNANAVVELRKTLTAISDYRVDALVDVTAIFQLRGFAPNDPAWNPSNARWAGLANLIRRDLRRDLSPDIGGLQRMLDAEWDAALTKGLTGPQVDRLLVFYHSAVGRRYVSFQKRLADVRASADTEMVSRMLSGGAGSPRPAEPPQDVLVARQHLLDDSWKSVVDSSPSIAPGQNPGNDRVESDRFAAQMISSFTVRAHGSELDDLRRQYASDLPNFERFHQSAGVRTLLVAAQGVGRDSPAAAQSFSAFQAALDRSIAEHRPEWRAAFAGAQTETSPLW